MTSRTKKVVKDHISSEEMELAFAGFAKADAQIQKLQAEMDLKMAAIREKYADRLQELTENKDNIVSYTREMAELTGAKILLVHVIPSVNGFSGYGVKKELLQKVAG